MIKLLYFVLLIPALALGQKLTTTEKNGNANIYNDAIRRFITYSTKGDKSISDTLFFQKDDVVTDSLMSTIQKTIVAVLDGDSIEKKLQSGSEFILH